MAFVVVDNQEAKQAKRITTLAPRRDLGIQTDPRGGARLLSHDASDAAPCSRCMCAVRAAEVTMHARTRRRSGM